MGFIIAIPALIAAWMSLRESPARAFLNVYVPVLLLLPEYYRWVIPALPDPTFSEAAILPVAWVFLSREARNWKFSLLDLLIVLFALAVGVSQYVNAGYGDAQNLMFDMIGTIVLPYAVAKGLIEPKGLRVVFARRFVFLLFVVSLINVYEFKMGITPWSLTIGRLFPGQSEGWVTTFRYGFARTAGPYGHAILAGLILILGFRIQRWLEWSGYWEPRFQGLPDLPLPKARIITLGLLAGILMTLVRGPWTGGIAGAILTATGLARNRKRALLLMVAGIVLIGVPLFSAFLSYASVGRANAKTDSQETAAYRYELIMKYWDIVMERPQLGWGLTTWPKVGGMPSIDNYYLLLALMHGLFADTVLILIILIMPFRLIRHDMQQPPPARRGGALGFTLAGVFIVFGVTIATVYMGMTAVPVFAILAGWAEGYLLTAPQTHAVLRTAPALASRPFSFRRVVV